jgi:hypothetical protein
MSSSSYFPSAISRNSKFSFLELIRCSIFGEIKNSSPFLAEKISLPIVTSPTPEIIFQNSALFS